MEGWSRWEFKATEMSNSFSAQVDVPTLEGGVGAPHQSPTLLLLKRQEGGDEVKYGQPDSKRASMLSKVGNEVGKTYNLFQVLFHILKSQTPKIKGSVSLMPNI